MCMLWKIFSGICRLDKYSCCFVKSVFYPVNRSNSFCHGSGFRIKIILSVCIACPALYHMSVFIITHPFPGAILTVCILSCP